MHRPRLFLAALACAATALPQAAFAGPPFATDDPVPTDLGHWEIYNFASLSHRVGETGGAAGLDLNYGGLKDLQLTAVFPLAYDRAEGAGRAGLGNIELAAKYRVLHQVEGTAIPDVALFPRVFASTGGKRFGTGRTNLLLPVWLGKDIGPWSVFGGGGYDINPGPGQRNYWVSGAGVTRAVSKRLTLGVEVYHHGPDADDAGAFTGVNLGAIYRLGEHWSLLASGGPGIQNARSEGQYSLYTALKADY